MDNAAFMDEFFCQVCVWLLVPSNTCSAACFRVWNTSPPIVLFTRSVRARVLCVYVREHAFSD